MKLRNRRWVLVLTSVTFIFCSCNSDTTPDTALPPAGNVDPNTPTNEHSDNGKEKLLDMALKVSGKKLSAKERGAVMRMLNLNEKDVIKGLGVWVELSDGQYPSSLDLKIMLKQIDRLLKAKYDRGEISRKQADQKGEDVFFAGAYYNKLVREKKDVAYYGDKVTVEDSDKVLMRWKTSNGRYRVIFGDLSRKTVTVEKLAELERMLPE